MTKKSRQRIALRVTWAELESMLKALYGQIPGDAEVLGIGPMEPAQDFVDIYLASREYGKVDEGMPTMKVRVGDCAGPREWNKDEQEEM